MERRTVEHWASPGRHIWWETDGVRQYLRVQIDRNEWNSRPYDDPAAARAQVRRWMAESGLAWRRVSGDAPSGGAPRATPLPDKGG